MLQALRVPQLALRRSNLGRVVRSLGTVETLHHTQTFVQVLVVCHTVL